MEFCAGVDEVGRGPLAGEVYAAAVILEPIRSIPGLRDSKALSARKRAILDTRIREESIAYCIATASVAEIDQLNILHASMLAMKRAVEGLSVAADFAMVDGNRLPDLPCPAEWLVRGDARFDAIKAASIIAKVARDASLEELDARYPAYGFARHKGYPTADHLAALEKYGPTPHHRMSFAPCRKFARA
ncbi:MAG: ribonuclease HII [Pseudomonadales bacterium]|nr:ribonuclease HII [Pseudomonadales bacterium]